MPPGCVAAGVPGVPCPGADAGGPTSLSRLGAQAHAAKPSANASDFPILQVMASALGFAALLIPRQAAGSSSCDPPRGACSSTHVSTCHPFAHTVAHAPTAYALRAAAMSCDTILTLWCSPCDHSLEKQFRMTAFLSTAFGHGPCCE